MHITQNAQKSRKIRKKGIEQRLYKLRKITQNYAQITQNYAQILQNYVHIMNKLRTNYANNAQVMHILCTIRKNYAYITHI